MSTQRAGGGARAEGAGKRTHEFIVRPLMEIPHQSNWRQVSSCWLHEVIKCPSRAPKALCACVMLPTIQAEKL